MTLSTIDLAVVIAYAVFIFALAQWVSRDKAGHEKDSSDYFLASKVTSDVRFETSMSFNVAALGVVIILVALYATWW